MREKIATAVIFGLLALPCGAIISMVDGSSDYRAGRAWQLRSIPEKALNLVMLNHLARSMKYNYATTYGSNEPYMPDPVGKHGWRRVLDVGFTGLGAALLFLIARLLTRRYVADDGDDD